METSYGYWDGYRREVPSLSIAKDEARRLAWAEGRDVLVLAFKRWNHQFRQTPVCVIDSMGNVREAQ